MFWFACCYKIVLREKQVCLCCRSPQPLLLCYYCEVAKTGAVVLTLLSRQLASSLLLHSPGKCGPATSDSAQR